MPQPLGPSREKNSPFWIPSETESTAFSGPKLFETFSNCRKLARAGPEGGQPYGRGA